MAENYPMETEAAFKRAPSWLWIVIIAGLFYVVGQYIASQPQRIQKEIEANREITVQGTGEITAVPDVAKISVGVTTGVQPSAERAITQLSEKFNAVVAAVRQQGVKEEDIKAQNVSVQPTYDFTDGRQTLRGFEASESIEITIRKLDTVGSVVSVATSQGANQIGGLQFTIDDPEALQLEAEEAAIEDAKDKAEQLAKTLGVSLGKVKAYNSSAVSPPGPFPYAARELAIGGDTQIAPPEVPAGTQDITANVTITYELK